MKLQAFDVVVVPFPFTDRQVSKRRPALVLSSSTFNDQAAHSVLAMITSAGQNDWPADVPLTDLKAAGLDSACLARLKLFTLDHRLIVRVAGSLAKVDRLAVSQAWRGHLAI